jgi:hypothetical protein
VALNLCALPAGAPRDSEAVNEAAHIALDDLGVGR